MLHLHRRIPLGRAVGLLSAALSLVALIAAGAALAADTVRPVVDVATLTPTAPDGNNNWRLGPATLNLSATDDVAVDEVPVLARRRRLLHRRSGHTRHVGQHLRPDHPAGQHDRPLPGRRQLRKRLARSQRLDDAEPAVGRRRDRRPAAEHDRPRGRRRARDRHRRRPGDGDDRKRPDSGAPLAEPERDC